MNKTLNALIAFILIFILFLFLFTYSIHAESNVNIGDNKINTNLMDQKSIDDLLGPDPYLFDPGNHMDEFDSSKSNNYKIKGLLIK